jgi:hypothetical protein
MPQLIVCADPLNPRRPDAHFADEVLAAAGAGFAIGLFDYEQLVRDGDAAGAVRRVAPGDRVPALLRSWMLRIEHYTALYDALADTGVRLINSPNAYRTCYELPAGYGWIAGHSPAAVWLPLPQARDLNAIMVALAPFGDQPVVLKDFVKSLAHAWDAACFIPLASDRTAVEQVVDCFLALRGEDLQGGLVFRAYERFALAAPHLVGRPQVREYRQYVLDGQVIAAAPYWDGADMHEVLPPPDVFADVLACIPSRLFTLDVAQRDDGVWRIVELGDGQVAGLLPHVRRDQYYRSIASILTKRV